MLNLLRRAAGRLLGRLERSAKMLLMRSPRWYRSARVSLWALRCWRHRGDADSRESRARVLAPSRSGDLPTRLLFWALGALPESESVPPSLRSQIAQMLHQVGDHAMNHGNLEQSQACHRLALRWQSRYSFAHIELLRSAATSSFLAGKIDEARGLFQQAGDANLLLRSAYAGSTQIRVLNHSWFIAIGHVAMMDFYFKNILLQRQQRPSRVLIPMSPNHIPGRLVAYRYAKYGAEFCRPYEVELAHDKLAAPLDLKWSQLAPEAHNAVYDTFWEYEAHGRCDLYTHAVAEIQAQWEQEERPPLVALDETERAALAHLKRQLGIPEDDWFVCLHVRETGFHRRWNELYPSARDAKIEDYRQAVEAIASRGGWVVRVGDPSMKRAPEAERLIDYVHSPFKSELADLLLVTGCRFFLGTNSGFATVPGIFGVPCVLTNWVPIKLPLWFGQDLMIPKLLWDREQGRYLSFTEMFTTDLGGIQNIRDFPLGIDVHDNSPQEIAGVVVEMIETLDGVRAPSAGDERLQQQYFKLAVENGSYKGSRIGRDFLSAHRDLLPAETEGAVDEEPPWPRAAGG